MLLITVRFVTFFFCFVTVVYVTVVFVSVVFGPIIHRFCFFCKRVLSLCFFCQLLQVRIHAVDAGSVYAEGTRRQRRDRYRTGHGLLALRGNQSVSIFVLAFCVCMCVCVCLLIVSQRVSKCDDVELIVVDVQVPRGPPFILSFVWVRQAIELRVQYNS